ncbi:hypothetical protein ACFL2X_07920, partial [Candidatus Latescibacterota bacterium]
MRKSKTMQTIMKATILTGLVLSFAGCGDDGRSASETANPAQKYVVDSSTTDPRIVISSLQRILEPAGVPLTDDQQERIKELFIPGSYDLRPMYGVLTDKQKRVLAEDLRNKLAGSEYPLSDSQFERFISFGQKSKVEKPFDILTSEQFEVLIPPSIVTPTKYPRVEIRPDFSMLKPAGVPLTDNQQELIKKYSFQDQKTSGPCSECLRTS